MVFKLHTLTFWQRLGVLCTSFILGSLCWSIFVTRGNSSNDNERDIDYLVDFNIPQRHYSPAEVVTIQIESIRDFAASPGRLTSCYSLASPKNREVTGPIKRFADMIMTPPYDQLARCQSWQVGGATIESNYASVLVSTISSDGTGVAFRFLLQLHKEPPYGGCWLTEAVVVLERNDSSDTDSNSPKEESPLD